MQRATGISIPLTLQLCFPWKWHLVQDLVEAFDTEEYQRNFEAGMRFHHGNPHIPHRKCEYFAQRRQRLSCHAPILRLAFGSSGPSRWHS